MAYAIPKMPILCNIFTFNTPTAGPPRAAGRPCQLRGVSFPTSAGHAANLQQPTSWILVLPKREDIRDGWSNFSPDIVEVPAGTGRFYRVLYVDDIARGFTNEYRVATLTKHGTWPVPIP